MKFSVARRQHKPNTRVNSSPPTPNFKTKKSPVDPTTVSPPRGDLDPTQPPYIRHVKLVVVVVAPTVPLPVTRHSTRMERASVNLVRIWGFGPRAWGFGVRAGVRLASVNPVSVFGLEFWVIESQGKGN